MIKSRKIGLLTLYENNYGSILQCFATKYTCQKIGYDCEIFFEIHDNEFKRKLKYLFSMFIHPSLFFNRFEMIKSGKIDQHNLSVETKKKMNDFVLDYIKPIGHTFKELRCISKSDEYVAFITGSDQVWNMTRVVNEIYFLNFAPNNKKIAFAPSLGINYIPNFNKKCIKYIKNFNDLSFREESTVDFIRKFYNGKISRIADPTIMINANEWRKIYGVSSYKNKKYVLAHFLNKPNALALECMKKYSENNDCSIIFIGYNYDLLGEINYSFIDGGPLEYLDLVDNSVAVFTDSFHTTLFSINFKKEFYVFNRQYSHKYSQSNRITDLLNRYNLSSRLINDFSDFQDKKIYDYSNILEKECNITKDYLFNRLKGEI